MSRAGPLIVFGLFLIVCGMYWNLWDGARSYLDNLVINDEYYQLMYWGWRIIPAVLVIMGIISLVSGGMSVQRETIE